MPRETTNPAYATGQSPDAYLLSHPLESAAQPIPVTPHRATIGRSPENTIVIDAETVSRMHAVIISRDGNYQVNDLKSRNGTYINGQKITVSPINNHDRIAFGNQTFLFLKRSDDKRRLSMAPMIEGSSTIVLDRDEIDPSEFLACATHKMRFDLLPPNKQPSGLDDAEIKRLKQAHQRLSLLYRWSERLRATQNLKTILADGLDLILEAIPTATRAAILLRSGRSGILEVAASRQRDGDDGKSGIQISRTLLDWVLTEKMALMTQNIFDDSRLKDSESIQLSHSNAVICAPIMAAEEIIGALYMDSENPFDSVTQEDAAFAAAVASELGLTIVNIRLQQTLIHNERMAAVGLTVSNLAHNIKNLAMMNQNAVALMQMHMDRIGDAKADMCWAIIGKSIARINDLSVEMLDYVGEHQLAVKPTEVNQAIRSGVEILAHNLEDKGPRLVFDLSPAVAQWTMDEKQFQRALVNLVVNAVDAVSKNGQGEIRIISALEGKQRLVVAVQDNGCGIDPEKKKKIFELFYTTKGTKGNGLGLPLVSKFVQASGGQLLVDSEPGQGTTFKMVFPRNG